MGCRRARPGLCAPQTPGDARSRAQSSCACAASRACPPAAWPYPPSAVHRRCPCSDASQSRAISMPKPSPWPSASNPSVATRHRCVRILTRAAQGDLQPASVPPTPGGYGNATGTSVTASQSRSVGRTRSDVGALVCRLRVAGAGSVRKTTAVAIVVVKTSRARDKVDGPDRRRARDPDLEANRNMLGVAVS